MNQLERCRYLIDRIVSENKSYSQISIPSDFDGQKQLLRGLMNVRIPKEIDKEFLSVQYEINKGFFIHKGIMGYGNAVNLVIKKTMIIKKWL